MSERRGSTNDRHQAVRYEIRLEGHLDADGPPGLTG